MFDAVRNNKKIVQIFLALITLPFAFWGVDSYVRNMGAGHDMASVGDSKITVPEFETAIRERQDQLRQSLGDNFRAELMNTTEVRLSVLNSLIDRRVLAMEAGKNRMGVSDATLREMISSMSGLQENGKFSMARYEEALRARGMSQGQFEAKLRQDLTLQQLLGGVGQTAFVTTAQIDAMLRLQQEERQFAEFRIAPEQFADKVKVEAAEVQKYYDENKKDFEVPEQVKAEYVVLSLEALMDQVPVSEAEARDWYEKHKDNYKVAEERRASHILIGSKGDDKEKAKAKAEEVLAEVRKSPAKFAELAKQYSEDPGSAKKGGDLGFFGRGMMVKPFEEAVFAQKEGDVSELVQSEFGYHIIKLTGIKGGNTRSFEEARAEIEGELKRQGATRKLAEAVEGFNNTVYEQAESLQPAADKFKLKIQRSDFLTKTPDAKKGGEVSPLDNEKLRAALFSDDAIKNKRNTESIEVAPNTLAAARVIEHVEASVKPFEAVKADVEKLLKDKAMAALAKQEGEAKLAELQKGGEVAINWAPVKTLSRQQVRSMPIPALQAVFKADAEKLPSYVGSELASSYMLYKVIKVTRPEKLEDAQRKALRDEYSAIIGQQDEAAYLASLRQRYKIKINMALIENHDKQ